MEAMSMTWRKWLAVAAIGATGIVGCSIIVDNELDDLPFSSEVDGGQGDGQVVDEFCRGREDGTDCSTTARPGHHCVDFQCVERRCGDGYVDEARGEECDLGDGNNNPNQGCTEDCQFPCNVDDDCDNGDLCDGDEWCDTSLDGRRICRDDTSLLPPNNTTCTIPDAEYDGGLGAPGFCCDGTCQSDTCL
jgi:hypothetical protein